MTPFDIQVLEFFGGLMGGFALGAVLLWLFSIYADGFRH